MKNRGAPNSSKTHLSDDEDNDDQQQQIVEKKKQFTQEELEAQ